MEQTLKYAMYILIGLGVLSFLAHFLIIEIRSHKRNNAPVETGLAMAYCKHPEFETTTVRTNVGMRNDTIHYITFHTESGDILKLYMHEKDYYAISDGSRGTLTWQADKFWKFEKEE